ncbi:MAG: nitroreductase family deazaflavin-dependent oxidoreductase [Actinomycetota bacterium]
MPLPRAIARFNQRVTNRFVEPIARRSSGFAVVRHTGRRSGATHATPVNLFVLDDGTTGGVVRGIVALTYGPTADWVQNVEAGGGSVESRSRTRRVSDVEIVDRSTAWSALPRFVRLALRVLRVRHFALLTLSDDSS